MSLKSICAPGIVVIASTLLSSASAQAAIPPMQRDALVTLYNGTGGDNWTNSEHWQKSPGVFNDTGTECSWFGVGCDAGETTVESLVLSSNRLTGPLPPELGDLANLRSLNISHNQLTGTIPAGLGNLAHLVGLDLGYNQLTGAIPAELASAANLSDLRLEFHAVT